MGLFIALGLVAFMAFLVLPLRVKALVAFILMMNFFDLGPSLLFGMYVWDFGAALMLILAVNVYGRPPILAPPHNGYLVVLRVFLAWAAICLLWSVLVYQYPIMHSIKSARQVLVGYFMTLIFIRLFRVEPNALEFLLKSIYWVTFATMPVIVLQYILHRQLMFGLVSDYEGVIRLVPVFLALSTLNLWILGAKVLSGQKMALHQWIYLALALAVVALSFTRGIYVAVMFTAFVSLLTMSRDGALKASSLMLAAGTAMLLMMVAIGAGLADKVLARAASGLDVLGAANSSYVGHKVDDTFSGRIGLAQERFALASAKNPIIGYGFIHEDDFPSDVRSRLKFGTPLGGTAADPTAFSRAAAYSSLVVLGFYTPDIAWPNFAIATGWIGVILLIALLLTFAIGHYRKRIDVDFDYALRTGLFLQMVAMTVLTLDGSVFWSGTHIPAFILAAYSMTGPKQGALPRQLAAPSRPPNLLP